jgi:hypothetical protein
MEKILKKARLAALKSTSMLNLDVFQMSISLLSLTGNHSTNTKNPTQTLFSKRNSLPSWRFVKIPLK